MSALRQVADRILDLAHRLEPLPDPVGEDRLTALLAEAGWTPAPDGVRAWADGDGITVLLPDPGDAGAVMRELAGLLDLPPAEPFDLDEHEYYPEKVRLRAGHWGVHLVVMSDGDDLPMDVEVLLAYGADLPTRLAQLAGPPPGHWTVDWDTVVARTGVDLPADHKWLLENYGTAPIGGRISLHDPATLTRPGLGEPFPVAVTDRGEDISYELNWEISGLLAGGRKHDTGLLHHVVVTLAGR